MRQQHTLKLATGERCHLLFCPVGNAHSGQHGLVLRGILTTRERQKTGHAHRHGLPDGQSLRDVTDGQTVCAVHSPLAGLLGTDQYAQKHRLARPIGAHNRHHLAHINREIHVLQHTPRSVLHADALGANQTHAPPP